MTVGEVILSAEKKIFIEGSDLVRGPHTMDHIKELPWDIFMVNRADPIQPPPRKTIGGGGTGSCLPMRAQCLKERWPVNFMATLGLASLQAIMVS